MLKKTLNAYHNRAIATQEVIEEVIKLAREMSAATQRGVDLGLNDDEIASKTPSPRMTAPSRPWAKTSSKSSLRSW